MLSIIFLVLQLALAVYISYLCIAFIVGAPFVPSTNPVAAKMVELARIKKGAKVYDLGSGDGRILRLAAQHGACATGLEINPWLVLYTNLRFGFTKHPGTVWARWRNFWRADYRDADIVFVYLLPWHMNKLADKLKRELKPGALVVTNSFIMPGWKQVRQDAALHVYAYTHTSVKS
jgi:cyclopropane fatty-acyl-phospholipid synthase-like methyltransferase